MRFNEKKKSLDYIFFVVFSNIIMVAAIILECVPSFICIICDVAYLYIIRLFLFFFIFPFLKINLNNSVLFFFYYYFIVNRLIPFASFIVNFSFKQWNSLFHSFLLSRFFTLWMLFEVFNQRWFFFRLNFVSSIISKVKRKREM